MRQPRGFTLIELLVVVAIIVVLLAILMPSINRAIEITRRTVCASRQHQTHLFASQYAADNFGKLPSTNYTRDLWGGNDSENHTIYISDKYYKVFVSGNGPTPEYDDKDDQILFCPNRQDYDEWRHSFGDNKRIGYHLLFGHYGTNYTGGEKWKSLTSLSDPDASQFIISDLIEEFTVFPKSSSGNHSPNGLLFWVPGKTPKEVGIEGSNVCYIGGAVLWRNMDDMIRYSVARANSTKWGWW